MTKLNIDIDHYTLSHLLKTPLTEILGMAELLKHECLSSVQYEEVEAIKQAGKRLLLVVDQVLKSQIEENINISIH
ncbi:MAG TPA: histidine kinase dimerization/phospho-acceptor domain-containing protein [Gammaproteobacteria bacterium]|jgi:signal transduction histidine kinase|nr:histidine kinase dimerization/phospho-acceptor domain-containing protein [Gammaproteobacteria bacterium]